jgi:hypothetical protein
MAAAPTPHAGGADWFRQALHAHGTATKLAPFNPGALADVVGGEESIQYHVRESLIVAACMCSSGASTPTIDELRTIVPDIERALGAAPYNHAVTGAVRLIKNLRPYNLRCMSYATILEPFEAEAKRLLGLSIERTFGLVYGMRFAFIKTVPPELRKLWPDIAVASNRVRSHADLWNRAAIEFPGGIAVLIDRLPAAVYEAICHRLDRARPGFFDRKGRRFETLVSQTVTSFFLKWDSYAGATINGNEKDLILVQNPLAVAVEAKALRLRAPSTDWNPAKAKKDLEPLVEALQQLREAVQSLRAGTKLATNRGDVTLAAASTVRGLVVTDQEYAHYCAVALDELQLAGFDWLDEGIVILSWVDLQLLFMLADCPSLVLDFWACLRGRPQLRRTDEMEAWMGYEMEPVFGFSRFLDSNVNVILSGTPPWPETPDDWETFLDRHRILWIRDWHALVALDRGGLSGQALAMVQADRQRPFPRPPPP